MKKSIVYLASIALLFSCDPEEVNPVNETPLLDYYITSFEADGGALKPQSKVAYSYNDSKQLTSYAVFSYDESTSTFKEQRHFVLSYENDRVSRLDGFLTNASSAYLTDTYVYNANGSVATITENNSGLIGTATFNYVSSDSVQVAYSFSNGSGFQYAYKLSNGNMILDMTAKGTELCSEGVYSYDNKPNPLAQLGYTDFSLLNASANNRLTEDVDYVACAFPSFIPDSFTYEYNANGYPHTATIIYKTSGSVAARSQKEFFYKQGQ